MSVWAGFWSERAGRAEQDADRMGTLLEELSRHHGHAMTNRERDALADCVRDWIGNRTARYRALPAGPTLEGNLKSGGIR